MIFRRIYIVAVLLIAVLGLLFISVTYIATISFYAASTQLLNKDVAAHIARFTSPYGPDGIDRKKADSVFYQAMVINPSAEVYFLDTTGQVIYFHGENSEIHNWKVDIAPLRRYLESGGLRYINGPDPRDPGHPKIFSAAKVQGDRGTLGYIYVILWDRKYRSLMQLLVKNRVTPVVLGAAIFILAVSLVMTLWYIRRIRRRLEGMIEVLNRFREGDFAARFSERTQDELGLITGSFNLMADLLGENIHRLTVSERERTDFMVNISHDLRTPLAVARGYLETLLLKRGRLSEEQEKEYMAMAVNKMRQVDKMVGQLFELSKMESINFEVHRELFVFSEILQEVMGTVVNGWKGDLVCENCTDSACVDADISMMERVVQNLLVNAIAYTREGGRIEIWIERAEPRIGVHISNEGEPLAEDLLKWANGKTDVRPNKSAIGLMIVRRALALHAFEFDVEVNNGMNKFSFWMPMSHTS